MAQDDRTFQTSTPAANRAEAQGLGVGQKEMDAQRAPNREQHTIDPQRTEPFEQTQQATSGDDRGSGPSDSGAGDPSQGPEREGPDQDRGFAGEGRSFDDRNAAGIGDAGDLGASTPAGVDIHDVGQDDKPEQDWGDEAEEGLAHSANHSRRGVKTEAERGQGAKTRAANKDIVSRRG
jgi:hypothetical protein